MHDVTIRLATIQDAQALAGHRAQLYAEAGRLGEEHDAVAQFASVTAACFRRVLSNGSYGAWMAHVAEVDVPVASAGVLFRPLLPRPGYAEPLEARVQSVYVVPEWRRCGIGRRLIETLLEDPRVRATARLVLHPTAEGRSLYASLGFVDLDEMIYRPSLPPGTGSRA